MHNLAETLQVGKWPLTKCIFRFFADRKSKMAARGRFRKKFKNIFCPKINVEYISGHFGQKKNFLFKKNFPAKKLRKFSGILLLCIRHFSDVFGPRAKAICTSALKLSTMENMLIMMNFSDFRPDRKSRWPPGGVLCEKKCFV